MKCKECKTECRLVEIPPFQGSDNEVGVTFFGLFCQACSVGEHEKKYPYPDFGADLINEIYSSGAFPASKTKGFLFWKTQRCSRCGSEVDLQSKRQRKIEGRIALAKLPPFRLVIDGPVASCRRCGASEIYADDETSFQINEAIINAFETVKIKP